ncbi:MULTISPECIES: hypothetical protein [Halorussus]|uniref:hypothetical protein n=1 Tax=Halorussus TaxID=1070314 RepID=UPI00209F78C5|nr:hypothetical protein [Halorussus vallis]USZ74152.1 hypothetical protein NGM07_11890 [Halorussus vallis]
MSAPGELEDQIKDTTTYREDATELVERDVAPATPAAFLEVLLRGVRDTLQELESDADEIATDDAVESFEGVLGPLEEQVDYSIQELGEKGTTIFEALVITLDTNYSEDIHQIWRLETVYSEDLTPDAKRELETLVTRLKDIDVARQYLKTVYIQEELSRLSRELLYVGIPVVFSGLLVMEVFISTRRPFLSPRQLSLITPVYTTVASAPLALLFSYVLRISVVAERTAAITPFTTPTQESTSMEAVGESADD